MSILPSRGEVRSALLSGGGSGRLPCRPVTPAREGWADVEADDRVTSVNADEGRIGLVSRWVTWPARAAGVILAAGAIVAT